MCKSLCQWMSMEHNGAASGKEPCTNPDFCRETRHVSRPKNPKVAQVGTLQSGVESCRSFLYNANRHVLTTNQPWNATANSGAESWLESTVAKPPKTTTGFQAPSLIGRCSPNAMQHVALDGL